MTPLVFKEAQSPDEFQQIHRLNHRVFADEIAQHHTNPSGLLVDRLHDQNRYFVALRDGAVIGMISAHEGPEFSISKRLTDPGVLRDFASPLEVRLLAIPVGERNGSVIGGLLWRVYRFAVDKGASHLLISAIAEREPMYRKLGFVRLGPAVPDGAASFIPMALALGDLPRTNGKRVRLHERRWRKPAGAGDTS